MSDARERTLALGHSDPDLAESVWNEVNARRLKPHPGGQRAILDSSARFRTLAAGRRWGKTKVAAP